MSLEGWVSIEGMVENLLILCNNFSPVPFVLKRRCNPSD